MRNILSRLLIFSILLTMALPAAAVLKEKNFEQTLNVLRAELEQDYKKQKAIVAMYDQRTKNQHDQLISTMQKCNQIALILYSQKSGFTFDMAYACQQATDMYRDTKRNNMPYNTIRQMLYTEVGRYDSLISTLEHLPPSLKPRIHRRHNTENGEKPDTTRLAKMKERLDSIAKANGEDPFFLDEDEQVSRKECVIYAKAIRNNIVRFMNQMEKDLTYYDRVNSRVEKLNNYAEQKYEYLRNSIFNNPGDNYLKILMRLPLNIMLVSNDISDKYTAFSDEEVVSKDAEPTHKHSGKSQWRGRIVPLTSVFMLTYVILSSILAFVLIKWVVPHRIRDRKGYKKKQPIFIIACGFIIFMITLGILKNVVFNNFLLMAMELLLEFSWLVVFILLSLLYRLNGDQIKDGVKQYTPFLVMAFIVIVFRIVFIPNNLVNLIFPPILLLFTIWQAWVFKTREVEISGSDLIYSIISLVAMIIACGLSFMGYTLLAVEIMIWWTFQLACIQTLTFVYDLCKLYEAKNLMKRLEKDYRKKNNGNMPTDKIREKIAELNEKLENTDNEDERTDLLKDIEKNEDKLAKAIYKIREGIMKRMAKGEFIDNTWLFDLFIKVLIPVLAAISVLVSLYMAADLFDMTDIFMKVLKVDFLKTSFIHISVIKLCMVIGLYFIFRYINYTGHALYKLAKNKRDEMKKAEELRRRKERGNEDEGEFIPPTSNITLANNVITLLVWGLYVIVILNLLNVPKSGITIITTGLATGMGFAMKDLLENFFYGISLMTGRIRVGDYIECDGIAGKVDSITYQSTQIVTRDGCIIAFLNSQLFTKNFKNLTRNHKYEMIKIPVGVAYGVNVQQVREIIIERIDALIEEKKKVNPNLVKKGTNVGVAFSDFGDSSVDLVVVAWVLVEEKIGFMGEAREVIYNALNENNIEIPFPQQDIHIRDTVRLPISSSSN